MNNPFEVLGLKGWADQDEIRTAYRTLVKQCHPDMIQDPLLKEEAQQRMVALNLAYEEALRLASPRPQAPAGPAPSVAEAVLMAERALARDNPERTSPSGRLSGGAPTTTYTAAAHWPPSSPSGKRKRSRAGSKKYSGTS